MLDSKCHKNPEVQAGSRQEMCGAEATVTMEESKDRMGTRGAESLDGDARLTQTHTDSRCQGYQLWVGHETS